MNGLQKLLLSLFLLVVLAMPVRAECSHDYVLIRQEPTCLDGGMEWLQCRLCGHCTGYKLLGPLDHAFDEWYVLQEPGQGFWDIPYKRAWYCVACEKMTLSVKKPAPHPHDPNTFEDYARQWKEMEEREKEEQRQKKKER